MSEFNRFAEELKNTVQTYFDEYEKASAKVAAIKAKIEAAENDRDKFYLRGDLTEAEEKLDRVKKKNAEVIGKLKEIRSRLESAADAVYCVDPSKLDTNVIRLLESGLVKVPEFEVLADKAELEGNSTMLRVIGAAAEKEAEARKQRGDRIGAQRLNLVSQMAGEHTTGAVLRKYDEMVYATRLAVGDPESSTKERSEPNPFFFSHWNDICTDAISEF